MSDLPKRLGLKLSAEFDFTKLSADPRTAYNQGYAHAAQQMLEMVDVCFAFMDSFQKAKFLREFNCVEYVPAPGAMYHKDGGH